MISTVTKSITPRQFGFQKGTSTLHQLLLFFHQLITSKDEIDVIYVDFRKAFDSVPHNELLMKLWNIGIVGTLWNTSKAYKSLGLLRRIINDIYCPEARKALYISITRSTILYCSCLWKPYLLSDIELIEKSPEAGHQIYSQ